MSPEDREALALRYHREVRKQDQENALMCHPLLSLPENCQPFPSLDQFENTSQELCGGNHTDHDLKDSAICYLYYQGKASKSSYGPPIPRLNTYPISMKCLEGEVPILDHIFALFRAQSSKMGGGSFHPFIEKTLSICHKNRQVGSSTAPIVNSIIFGKSSKLEVDSFLKSFNDTQTRHAKNQFGHLPHQFYSLDIQHLVTSTPPIILSGKEKIPLISSSTPARLSLGFWNERWDIIFPFKSSCMDPNTYEAEYTLKLDKIYPDYWIIMFQKLQGLAIGVNILQEINTLDPLISCYRFYNRQSCVKIKTADLNALLCMAGWNDPNTSHYVLSFAFTGGIIQMQKPVQAGFGNWSQCSALPHHTSSYLQARHISNMNAAVISSITWLLHWFATPGIAALCSRKDPMKFLSWFSRFQVSLLGGAHFKNMNTFNWSNDRECAPYDMIAMIQYDEGNPVFSAKALSECVPSFRNVTGGGPSSDQEVIDFLIIQIRFKLQGESIPQHLRWQSSEFVGSALTAKHPPSATGEIVSTKLGCHRDKAVLTISKITDRPEYADLSLKEALRRYKATISEENPLSRLSSDQLLLLFIWRFPRHSIYLYESSVDKYFHPNHLDMVKPLLSALAGRELRDSISFKRHKEEKLRAREIAKYDKLSLLSQPDSLRSGVKRKMVKIEKKLGMSAHQIEHQVKDLRENRELISLRHEALLTIIEDADSSDSAESSSSDQESSSESESEDNDNAANETRTIRLISSPVPSSTPPRRIRILSSPGREPSPLRSEELVFHVPRDLSTEDILRSSEF